MTKIPIAIQLYSLGQECARDLPGTLAAVAGLGYDGVEFAGYHGYSALSLKRLLDDLGLRVAGAHVSLEEMLGDAFPETIAFHQELGNRFLIVPWLTADRVGSQAAWRQTAALLNETASALRPYSLQTGYHNHVAEFTPFPDGETPWDIVFSRTDSDVVMQLDMGNARHGGADVVAVLERYPRRAATVHLKDYAADDPNALIGEGEVPWDRVFSCCEAPGNTEWYIVEQEANSKFSPLEAAERCLRTLRAKGK